MFQPFRSVTRTRTRTRTRALLLFSLSSALFALLIAPQPHAASMSGPAPEIMSDTWINSAPKRMADLHGRVVLVEFWTFSCWNCRNVEPYVKQWYGRYNNQGLDVIAVHAPEFDSERQVDNVRAYITSENITYPVAVDNDFANWNRYQNRFWPTLYLIDKRGMLRYRKIGEGDYAETEREIRTLLDEVYP